MEKKRAGKKLENGFFINNTLLFDYYFASSNFLLSYPNTFSLKIICIGLPIKKLV